MKLDLLNRTITATALVAFAITLGVWLTASPAAAPVETAPEPTLAPLPVAPTVIEVPVEVEIAEPAQPKPACPPHRRGLFRRR